MKAYFAKFPCVYNIGDLDINLENILLTRTSVRFALEFDFFQQINCPAFIISSDQPNNNAFELIEKQILFSTYNFNIRYYLLIETGTHNKTFNATWL